MTTKTLSILLSFFVVSISFGQKVPSRYFTDSIFSTSLNETRKMNIYLPPGYKKGKNYPIIYMTDGSEIKNDKSQHYVKTLFDSLIGNEIIRPTIVVEEYCNQALSSQIVTYGNGDTNYVSFRAYEYVESWGRNQKDSILSTRFKNHMAFFTEEMIPYAEAKYVDKINATKRYFFGVSNGAGFGVNLMNKKPELIGTYICYSTGGSGIDGEPPLIWDKTIHYPKIYFQVGNERDFKAESEEMGKKF
jgi:predicted alpha/beta superfamily hydrolase